MTGDFIRNGGVGVVDLLVRGNDGLHVANMSVAVEPQAPLRVTDLTTLGWGRYQVTLGTAATNKSSIANVRIVANAPGFYGGDVRLDYVVLAAPTTPMEVGWHGPDEVSIVPLLAAGVVAIAAGATLVVSARRRRVRR